MHGGWGNFDHLQTRVINLTLSFLSAESSEPYMKIPCNESKITSAVWGPLGEFIIAGHENGELNQFSAKVTVMRSSALFHFNWGQRRGATGYP